MKSAQERLSSVAEPFPDSVDAIAAFNALDAGRAMGFAGPLPIPLTEIEAYIRLYRVRDADRLVRLVRAQDRAFLGQFYEMNKTDPRPKKQRPH